MVCSFCNSCFLFIYIGQRTINSQNQIYEFYNFALQFLHCEHYDGQLEGKIRQATLSTVTTISFGKSKVQHYESTKVVVSSIVYTFLHLEGICEFSDAFHRRDLKLASFIGNCNVVNSHGVATVLMYSTLMSLDLLNCFFTNTNPFEDCKFQNYSQRCLSLLICAHCSCNIFVLF